MEEKELAAILAANRSSGVAPEMNLKECVTCTPPPSANKAAQSGFEPQRRRHQSPKQPHKKNLYPPKIFQKDTKEIKVCEQDVTTMSWSFSVLVNGTCHRKIVCGMIGSGRLL